MNTIKASIFKTGEVTVMSLAEFLKLPITHELYVHLGFETKKEARKYSADFWLDCDHVKDGRETSGYGDRRGCGLFTDIETPARHYIITKERFTILQGLILSWWLNGSENRIDLGDTTWNAWDTVREGVAYRGGAGYFYSLYAKTLIAEPVTA